MDPGDARAPGSATCAELHLPSAGRCSGPAALECSDLSPLIESLIFISTLGPLNQKPGLRRCFFPHYAQFYVLAFLPRVNGGEL